MASMIEEVHRDLVRCEKLVHHPAFKQPVVPYLVTQYRNCIAEILKTCYQRSLANGKLFD